jgi:hypothetical protein
LEKSPLSKLFAKIKSVPEAVGEAVNVEVGRLVEVGVLVDVCVEVGPGVNVDVAVNVAVGVNVDVAVNTDVGVRVAVKVAVNVGVGVWVGAVVMEAVTVAVGEDVGTGVVDESQRFIVYVSKISAELKLSVGLFTFSTAETVRLQPWTSTIVKWNFLTLAAVRGLRVPEPVPARSPPPPPVMMYTTPPFSMVDTFPESRGYIRS